MGAAGVAGAAEKGLPIAVLPLLPKSAPLFVWRLLYHTGQSLSRARETKHERKANMKKMKLLFAAAAAVILSFVAQTLSAAGGAAPPAAAGNPGGRLAHPGLVPLELEDGPVPAVPDVGLRDLALLGDLRLERGLGLHGRQQRGGQHQ